MENTHNTLTLEPYGSFRSEVQGLIALGIYISSRRLPSYRYFLFEAVAAYQVYFRHFERNGSQEERLEAAWCLLASHKMRSKLALIDRSRSEGGYMKVQSERI